MVRIVSADFLLDSTGVEKPVKNPELLPPNESEAALLNEDKVRFAFDERSSDAGHFSYGPDGALALRLMELRLCALARDLMCAEEIRTPLVFRTIAPGVAEESGLFHGQMYHCGPQGTQDLLLRPGGDYGAFSFASAHTVQLGTWPARVFECGPAFRRIQRSRISGIASARAFTILDYHSFCASADDLWSEWSDLVQMQLRALGELGANAKLNLEVVADYYETNKTRICCVLNQAGVEASVSLLPRQRNYWMLQHRWHLANGVGLMDGQLDHLNGARFGIVTPADQNAHALICHGCWGTVERWLACQMNSDEGALPFWLAPVQLLLLPCSEEGLHLARSLEVGLRHKLRIRVQNSDAKLSKRLKRASEVDPWAVVVLGDREAAAPEPELSFRRPRGRTVLWSWRRFEQLAAEWMTGKPFLPLPPVRYSPNISK